jgi:hypothetical protein
VGGKTSIKLNKSLCDRAKQHAEASGYSSVKEFVEHVLEKELARLEESGSRAEVENKLKGLGYLE